MLIIREKDTNMEIKLDYVGLDFGFGLGDYFYNGKCSGSQLGFYWLEEEGQEYIEHLYFNVYVGNEEENDIYTLNTMLVNLTPNEKKLITLSQEDFKIFLKWYNEVERIGFHYYTDEEIKELEK